MIVLAEGFADQLVELRSKFNRPMQITSACRSRDYNRKIGGAEKSFHIYDYPPYYPTKGCCAVDVAVRDPTPKTT